MSMEATRADVLLVGMLTEDSLRMDGLQSLLGGSGLYRVVSVTAADGSLMPNLRVAVLDAGTVPHLDAMIRAFRRQRPEMDVLVVGEKADHENLVQVISCGAKGYLEYGAGEKAWCVALQAVLEGSIWAPRRVLASVLERRGAGSDQQPRFTPRENEVLQLLMQGMPNREIARALCLDEATVKAHLGRLMRKCGVRNRTALSLQAMSRVLPRELTEKLTMQVT